MLLDCDNGKKRQSDQEPDFGGAFQSRKLARHDIADLAFSTSSLTSLEDTIEAMVHSCRAACCPKKGTGCFSRGCRFRNGP
jgi:hypothetical protein